MCGKWNAAIIPIILITGIMLNICPQTDMVGYAKVEDVSITYLGAGVGNLTMGGNLPSQNNHTGNASLAPDLVFQNTEPQPLIVPGGNILNRTNCTNPRETMEEPRNDIVLLLFASLIPIVGMPFHSIIKERRRSLVLIAESLSR